jgi:uncharacterized protein (TIGR03067 family)
VRALSFLLHRVFVMFLMSLATTSANTSQADDKTLQLELEALKGKWIAVSVTGADGLIPKEKWEREQPAVTFKGEGKAVFSIKNSDGKEAELQYIYTIDPSKSPKAIDLTNDGPSEQLKGKKQYGIYKLEKGKLTICVTGSPGATEEDRPKEFTVTDKRGLLEEFERPKDK